MELQEKRKTNFMGLKYIPRSDLDIFLVLEVVRRVVDADTSHELEGAFRDAFVRRIQNFAVKLFAICIFSNIRMGFLRHLIDDHKCSDDPENHPKRSTSERCTYEFCTRKVADILERIPIFFVQNVKRDYKHYEFGDSMVLPLHHAGPENHEGVKAKVLLGEHEGAVGKVYKVTIDPAHHYLSGVRLCP